MLTIVAQPKPVFRAYHELPPPCKEPTDSYTNMPTASDTYAQWLESIIDLISIGTRLDRCQSSCRALGLIGHEPEIDGNTDMNITSTSLVAVTTAMDCEVSLGICKYR
jgi:hypothetical protein